MKQDTKDRAKEYIIKADMIAEQRKKIEATRQYITELEGANHKEEMELLELLEGKSVLYAGFVLVTEKHDQGKYLRVHEVTQ